MPWGPINPNFGRELFNPADKTCWEEVASDHGSRQDTITHGESLCTMRGYVLDHTLILSALAYWLGFSWVETPFGADPRLRRQPPAPHPETNNLFARRVIVSGWRYRDKIKVQGNAPQNERRLPFARHHKYLFEIDFQSVDYDVLPDDFKKPDGTPINDWERFISVTPEDETEIIAVNAGTYQFKTGTQANKPVNTHGPVIRKYVERTELTITARQLPYDLIFNNYNIPLKIMKCKGRVNSRPFLGINPQCLLLKSWKPVKYPQPVGVNQWTFLQFGLDIEFKFSYQEPTKFSQTETLAGWNLLPDGDPRWEAPWHGVQTVPGNQPMYSSVDFYKMLTHWSINDLT